MTRSAAQCIPSTVLDPAGGGLDNFLRSIDGPARHMGPAEHWPALLRTSLSSCLASPCPSFIVWGPDRLCFYNHAAAALLGPQHPGAWGEHFLTACPALWHAGIGALTEATMNARHAIGATTGRLALADRSADRLDEWRLTGALLADESEHARGVLVSLAPPTPPEAGEPPHAPAPDLIGLLPAAVYTCDSQGRIIRFNDAAADLWGRRPEVGKDLWCGSFRIYRPDGTELPLDRCPMAMVLRGEAPGADEIVIERPDGTRRHVLPFTRPLRNADGRITGALGMLVDVTDRRMVEAKLAETRADLSVQVEAPDSSGRTVCGVAIDFTEHDRAEQERREAADLLEGSLDALTGHIAILDRSGTIIRVNEAWRRFAEQNGFAGMAFGVGSNYLDACTPHLGQSTGSTIEAAYAAQGIRDVMDGVLPTFVMEYSCHAPAQRRWFVMRVTRFGAGDRCRMVVAHEDVTDRREVEQIIVRNAERLRLANEAANLGTWELDPRTRRISWDARGNEHFGRRESGEMEFDELLARIQPSDRDLIAHGIEKALDPDGRGRFDVEYRVGGFADGFERWHRANGQASFEDGRPTRFIGTVQDITDRKRAEDALRRNEEQFRTLANSIPQLAWMARPDGHITWYNQRWYEYTGTTFEQMEGWGWQSVHDPQELPRVVRRFKDALASGGAWEDTFPLRRHDGEMRWHLSRAHPLRDERGRIVRWFGTNTDITAQREAEETLRASEERFRLLADSSPTLIWISAPDKSFTWLNRAWLEFTGRTMAQECGGGWTDGIHPEDTAGCLDTYSRAFEARRDFRLEFRLRRDGGEYRWVLSHGTPMYGAGGKFTGYIGSCYDMTDQVLARQTLERQQAILEEAVLARTAELRDSNERLRLAERMASLGTLSAGLGHDMGNLLVPIRVRLDSLSRADLAPEQQEDLEAIRTSAAYLQRLANGLRMLASDPKRAAPGESTSLPAWWNEAEPLLKNALPTTVTLHADIPEVVSRAAISKAALTQAVFNLVQNAGEALRPRGSGNVSIRVQAAGDCVRLLVADDGPGMSPEVRARCMEPFFTTKPRAISTGLGLLLVYGLVRDADGSIDLESEPGAGTTFTITLPRATEDAAGAGPGGTASVDIRDARLRALVTAELRALAFRIVSPTAESAPDVLVTDEAVQTAPPARGHFVLLCSDSTPAEPGVVALGARPSLQTIRGELRRIARGEP